MQYVPLNYAGGLEVTAQCGNPIRRQVVKNESDAILGGSVDYAVGLLVVDLVGLADLHAIRPAVDHEAHAVVRRDGYVNAMAVAKSRVTVKMWVNATAGKQFRGHGPNDRAARGVCTFDQCVHDGYRRVCEQIPAFLLADDEVLGGPVAEHENDRLRLTMHVVIDLALLVRNPGVLVELRVWRLAAAQRQRRRAI